MARHNPGWGPDRHDVDAYLRASGVRYQHALDLMARGKRPLRPGDRVLDVGGFMGAFPLALARLGYRVTLSERYDYYGGALDELRDRLVTEGVEVLDLDLTERTVPQGRQFDAITNMAMLEHLAHTPRPLLENMRASLHPEGTLVVEVPNFAFWLKRLLALRGDSTLAPLRDVYEAEIPFTGHHREYTAQELTDVLQWSGLHVDEMVFFNYSPFPGDKPYLWFITKWPQRIFKGMRETLIARATLQAAPG